jgi:transglutaminase-like putative cysteine protease
MQVDAKTDETQVEGPTPPDDRALAPTWFLDSDHPQVAAFAAEVTQGAASPEDKAIRLFYAVRDRIYYDPYSLSLKREFYRASHCLAAGRGYCVYKAGLMTAAARAAGIPARVGFADVRNHLCTPRLKAVMGGIDIFYYHGYAALWLDGRWVKVTPVFNAELCAKFGVVPQEFDGVHDSLFQPFDAQNRKHMEYIHDRGTFDDIPFEKLCSDMREYYPLMFEHEKEGISGDFAAEAAAGNS